MNQIGIDTQATPKNEATYPTSKSHSTASPSPPGPSDTTSFPVARHNLDDSTARQSLDDSAAAKHNISAVKLNEPTAIKISQSNSKTAEDAAINSDPYSTEADTNSIHDPADAEASTADITSIDDPVDTTFK